MTTDLQLPPGFRFHPTDEELVRHYLCRKCASQSITVPIIAEIDLYKYDPWDLPGNYGLFDLFPIYYNLLRILNLNLVEFLQVLRCTVKKSGTFSHQETGSIRTGQDLTGRPGPGTGRRPVLTSRLDSRRRLE